MLNRRAISRSRRAAAEFTALAALLALVTLLWHPKRALAGDAAPDWLRAAAQEKLPEYPKDTSAVVLLDEAQTTVKDNGEIETRVRRAFRILRPEGVEQYGFAGMLFSNDIKISFFKAWTITTSGAELEVKEKDAAERTMTSYELFSDLREKILRFPEAKPGNVVGFECVQKQRPQTFDNIWTFQERVPVRRSRFVLQLPAGWEYTTRRANHAEQQPQMGAPNQYIWEVTDSPGIEIEPDMPPWPTIVDHMIIKYFPRDPRMRAKATGTWNEIGAWYYSLISPRRMVTPEIQKKVAELTASSPDLLSKIKALAAYSQTQIRYAAIEVGIGGHQPHAAGDVLAHGYGDCKDKATLLNTMLQVIGVEAYNVMISADRGYVRQDFPTPMFGHSISAIRVPDGVPAQSLYATVDDPKLGKLLFFDPTDPYTALGYLPSSEQDGYALVVSQAGGELVRVPLLPASTNRLLRTGTLTLSEAGSLDGTVQEARWGAPAELRRAQLIGIEPKLRAKVFEEFLGTTLNSFTLTHASIGNLEQYDQTLTLNYSFVSTDYAKPAGNLLILQPRVVGTKGWNILAGKPRKYPIEFKEATRQDDVFDITLPKGYVVDELPKPVKAECPYGTYKSEVQVNGNVLHYKRTYEITDVVVPTQKLDEVKDFFHQIAADEHSSAILKRASP
jgi:hypothetical protein